MKKQKGFSLVLVFFIMAIMLSVVLSITALLFSEINTARNTTNSVSAYYLAESGMEKILFFDRKEIPAVSKRGLCNVCNICAGNNSICQDCTVGEGEGCALDNCTDCQVSFKTSFANGDNYVVRASVTPSGDFSDTDIYSTGNLKDVVKTIQAHFSEKTSTVSKPVIQNASASPVSVPESSQVTISAEVSDSAGIKENGVKAVIKTLNPDGVTYTNVDQINLSLSGGTYLGVWTGPAGVYYVDIVAENKLGKRTTASNI